MEKKDRLKLALGEAEEAVNQVKNGRGVIELSPQNAYIRRLQHLIAERNDLLSKSLGKDPQRRVTIYKD
jgi:predicted RNA-binding protein Jag